MKPSIRLFTVVAFTICVSASAGAATATHVQDGQAELSRAIQMSAECAPQVATPVGDALRIIGGQDTVPRSLFAPGDLLVVGDGARRGIQVGQQFLVRRPPRPRAWFTFGPRAVTTAGAIRVVAVDERAAIAEIEFACDGMMLGDYLEPYVAPVLPSGTAATDASGAPDFATEHYVLFGDNERASGSPGDFMVSNFGERDGARPGARIAIYRDVGVSAVPLVNVGEAILISVKPDTSVFRITRARDAVYRGDLVFPRRTSR
jgi:hypothetical protein